MIRTSSRNVLPTGYQLQEYRILSVLGHGGFGITYLAQDTKLNLRVAIKEYFPSDLAVREESYNVQPKFQKYKKNFVWGLKGFLKEGQALATFQHPSIVRVLRYFEAHNTAYIVMEYEQGQSLSNALKNGSTLTKSQLMTILPPLLSGLQAVHEMGFLHRDIKPGNIYLRDKDNTPVLLDFGAARFALGNLSRSITALVTPGYTPFEQYQTKGPLGPWTDIYAVGAVLYRAISGQKPVESPARINLVKLNDEKDPLEPITKIGRRKYPKRLLQGIDWALQISEKDRPQNVKEWAAAMLSSPFDPSPTPQKNCKWWILAGVIVATGINVGYFIYHHAQLRQQKNLDIQKLQEQATAETARLTQLQSEQSALQKAIKKARLQIRDISNTKEVEEQKLKDILNTKEVEEQKLKDISKPKEVEEQKLKDISKTKEVEEQSLKELRQQIKKLNQQIKTETAHLAQIQESIKEAGTKIIGNNFRDRLQDGSLGPEMVVVPAGLFRMGDSQDGGYKDEQPVWVSVNNFAIGRYEVTFEEYDRFAEATGREKPDDQGWGRGLRPVINVSWKEATAYAAWLSLQTGQQYRLPTEAEWEYAARAGIESQYWWGNEMVSKKANCNGCNSQWDNKKTAPVGSFSSNAFGLYDTVGNVWEWTCSEYERQYLGKEQECINNINNEKSQTELVIRGGSCFNKPKDVRAANRNWSKSSLHFYSFGFRLVRM
jgi:formylglycine-generating enzyme required for sulfatase activity